MNEGVLYNTFSLFASNSFLKHFLSKTRSPALLSSQSLSPSACSSWGVYIDIGLYPIYGNPGIACGPSRAEKKKNYELGKNAVILVSRT